MFELSEWDFSGPNALDGETDNATADTPFPIGTYTTNGCPPVNGCMDEAMIMITISTGAAADAGSDRVGCGEEPISLTGSGTGIWSGGTGTYTDQTSGSTTYTPGPGDAGNTFTLTFTTMSMACGNSSDDISVTIFTPAEDSEFFYTQSMVCPDAPPLMAMHTTGTDGLYSYEVLSGGPLLDLNPMTGMVIVSASDVGVYAITNTIAGAGELIISGIADGTLPGGQPKAIELYALSDVADLGAYGIGIAPNGNGSSGADYTFPNGDTADEGDFIYITADAAAFQAFFGFAPDYITSAISFNGDDGIELFQGTTVIDAYGEVDIDGTGMPWEYTDGWVYRMNNTDQGGGFEPSDWTYGGVNSLEGGTTNNTANNPFPLGTFTTVLGPICPPDQTTVMLSIGDDEPPMVNCPGNQFIALESGECSEVVNLQYPTATDNCGDVMITQTEGPMNGSYVHLDDSPITVSFDIADATGQTTSCSYQITIVEFDSGQTTLTCNDNLNISLDDNCEALITPDMILEGGTYGCFEDYAVETSFGSDLITNPGSYTVTITDPETGNSCWSDIVVEDKLDASLMCSVCPPGAAAAGAIDCIFSCVDEDAILAGLIAVPGPDITDNCGDASITFTDAVSEGTTCGSRIISRTYAVIAGDGTIVSSCTSEYLLNPLSTTDDQFGFPPSPVLLPCGTGTDPADVAAFFDNKTDTDGDGFPDTPINPSNDIPVGPNCPVDVIEKHEGIKFGYVHYFATGCDGQLHAQPIENSVCDLNVSYTDQVIPDCGVGCGDNIKVIRTWSVLDWCDPSATPQTYTQIVKSTDTEAPTIEATDVDGSVNPWTCMADISLPPPTLLHDACTVNLSYTISGPAGVTLLPPNSSSNPTNHYIATGIPIGDHVFTYTASDCCGNIASTPITVRIKDVTPPIPTAVQNIVVNLTTDGDPVTGIAKVFATSVDNGSYDSCTDVKIEIRRNEIACGYSGNGTFNADGHPNDGSSFPTFFNFDPDDGAYIKVCCEDIPVDSTYGIVEVLLRVWDDGNQTGFFGDYVDFNGDGDTNDYGESDNYNETWAHIRVEGKSNPVIFCPDDITISCDDDYTDTALTGTPTGVSLCGAFDYEVSYTENLDACGMGFVIASFTAVGSSPVVTCNQRIDIVNDLTPFDPSSINYPSDLPTNPSASISCTDEILYEDPTWVGGTCDFIGVTEEVDTFFFETDPDTGEPSDACFKILRQFTVIDWCLYDATDGQEGSYTGSQTIKITDSEAPVLSGCEHSLFSVTDGCMRSSTTLTNAAVDNGDCASDWLKWQVFVDTWSDGIVDYEYSSFLPSNDSNLNNDSNGNGINDMYIAPTSSEEEVSITILEDMESSMFNHIVVWKVTDGCGNVASCETTFMVVDNKAPTPYCLELSTGYLSDEPVELWAIDFDLGAFDNCTETEDLRFTFTDTPPSNDSSYDPEVRSSSIDLAICGMETLDIYVWDEMGNYDFCTVTVTGNTDPGCVSEGIVLGRVATENGMKISDATVTVSDMSLTETLSTNEHGEYALWSAPYIDEIEISIDKEDIHTNGVSTLDLVLIQRHILDFQNLLSPYKIIAADINNDEEISLVDIVELRKVVLGIQDQFNTNRAWRFIPASHTFSDDGEIFPVEDSAIIELDQELVTQADFVAVKIGDVNHTASNLLAGMESEVRSDYSIWLDLEDRYITKGEEVAIILSSEDFKDIYGMQMSISLDGLDYQSIQAKALDINSSNIALTHNGDLNISWHQTQGTTVLGDLMVIHCRARENGMLSQMVSINNEALRAEAYQGDRLEIENVMLRFNKSEVDNTISMSNYPNPFSDRTTISFTLDQPDSVKILLRDVTGRLLYHYQADHEAGTHYIECLAEDLSVTGVIYYTLETTTMRITDKMILMK